MDGTTVSWNCFSTSREIFKAILRMCQCRCVRDSSRYFFKYYMSLSTYSLLRGSRATHAELPVQPVVYFYYQMYRVHYHKIFHKVIYRCPNIMYTALVPPVGRIQPTQCERKVVKSQSGRERVTNNRIQTLSKLQIKTILSGGEKVN